MQHQWYYCVSSPRVYLIDWISDISSQGYSSLQSFIQAQEYTHKYRRKLKHNYSATISTTSCTNVQICLVHICLVQCSVSMDLGAWEQMGSSHC